MGDKVSSGSVYAKQILMPESVIFSVYTTEELRKLCTTKIQTALSFDAMGHPLPGGLYDRTMGPLSEKSLPCGTCNKSVHNCPGHLGYIELPLPVVNPVFHTIIASVLRLSCLQCYKMQIPECTKKLLSLYMQLLDCGMVTEAKEVEHITKEIISENKFALELPVDKAKRVRKLQRMANSVGNPAETRNILNKTTESLRNKLLHELLKNVTVKKCIFCKSVVPRIQFTRRKLILNTRAINQDKSWEKISNDDTVALIKSSEIKLMMPEESRENLRKIWINDRDLLLEIVPVLKRIKTQFPTDIFYFEILPVIPPVCRPVNYLKGQILENPQSQIYKNILQDSMVIRTVISVMQGKNIETLPEESQTVFQLSQGKTVTEKLHNLWQSLQTSVDCIMDRELNPNRNDSLGLKQIIEKKSGIIRMHMMGKRVNYAARSVITPDPNLNIDEIGVPEEFAKQLTYPVPVTSWNVEELRKMVLNGPNVHPGAKLIEFEDGSNLKIGKNKESILKRLLTPIDTEKDGFKGVKIVHRHLVNGDVLLLNRQPTLHRPSIMAHTARILKNEKTIRLHYANCKAYNADFDGDEMNMHFPQSELARSEGYFLANVSNQYLVPKDGTPLSGLIQDHMVSGVRLSVRGKFFKRHDYHQLVYSAISYKTGRVFLLPPAILKPEVLWSGKQVLSTVIINTIPKNREPLNLTATAKISARAWQNHPSRGWKAGGTPFSYPNCMTEAEVIIRNGELLTGVLDKTHYGATPYGLIHCMYELYGGEYATKLLSSFAKLFTCFLQQQGFTLGVHDILVQKKADKKRSKIIKECRNIGKTASALALDVSPDIPDDVLLKELEIARAKNPKFRTIIDRQYKQSLDAFTNEINKTCLPAGLVCKFPSNNLQLMVQSGAKGSTVNTMQISCLLGQIELEGKRPPLMISGKSLPSFIPFDPQPRAGGFIDGRFMTGILPQEFFFHCMAGREGLIDTAVKTSRSGYLQRCLVKHLEGLRVCYDLTVRDSDQSVIQYAYGEDGMDISKVQFLNKNQLKFLAENRKAIVNEQRIRDLKDVDGYSDMEKRKEKIESWKSENGDPLNRKRNSAFLKFCKEIQKKLNKNNKKEQLIEMWQRASPELRKSFEKETSRCPDPVTTEFSPDHYYGSLNDNIEQMLKEYSARNKRDNELSDALKLKAMQSLAAPGEPVGMLAAQSIGEPSTQMTLNTFHFAGRGEMNVTLGIPRLREILMMASANIKTPSMEIPFQKIPNIEKIAENLRKHLTRVTVSNVLEKVDVGVKLRLHPAREYSYTLRFHFLPEELYQDEFNLTSKKVLKHMTKQFFHNLFNNIRKYAKKDVSIKLVGEVLSKKAKKKKNNDEEEEDNPEEAAPAENDSDSSEEEPEGGEEDAKMTYKHKAIVEAQEPEDEEKEQSEDEEPNEIEKKSTDEDSDEGTDDKVTQTHHFAREYKYDKKNHLWCELVFCLPLSLKNMDLTALIRETAEKSVVTEVENIKRAITYSKDEKELILRTDGINMTEMFKHRDILDLNRLYSNDIHKIAETYGIEAARRVIVKEVKDVFNVYGITVDPRHLLLIADYMTYNGTFEPLSRRGMECNASPLQQMSFESSLTFLKSASIRGKEDSLTSPSSCLMIGKPCKTGTGAFSLLQKMPTSIC